MIFIASEYYHYRQGYERETTICFIAFEERMYQSPVTTHGFNHQSFFRQPVSNLRQVNDVVWNRKNETQYTNNPTSLTYGTAANQQYVPGYANTDNGYYSTSKDQSEFQIQPSQPVLGYQENGLIQTMTTGYPSTRCMLV